MKQRYTIISLMMFLAAIVAQAQITIGGNVYGGGNAGETGGSTKVTVYGGTMKGSVFGGAKQASVKGSAFVHIDGEHMSGDIVVKAVYGGNDISGNVGTSTNLPDGLTKAGAVGINETYNAFVRTSKERTKTTGTGENVQTTQPFSIFIGTLYGGGNGDYRYSETANAAGNYVAEEKQKDGTYKIAATSKTPFEKPIQDKIYLEIMGGTIAYLYGGGNNATVDVANDIYINNDSEVTTNIQGEDPENPENTINLLTSAKWLESMGIASLGGNATRADYQFSRVFGGNNKAVMRIQPTWHLKNGKIENLYSGGNEGDMCSSSGLLLEIGKVNPDNSVMVSNITVKNVFGGCRKANVRPQSYDPETKKYVDIEAPKLPGYNFPAGFSARVLIRSGNITNVYGGNDISGHVYGGNAVGVHTSISGNIYGGGNGSYPYTDNSDLANTLNYGDYYYNPIDILDPNGTNKDANDDPIFATDEVTGKKTFTALQSLEALSLHRPDAEQVSIRVVGKFEKDSQGQVIESSIVPTIIGGAIYVGGNSATLKTIKENPIVELKVGSYVIADEVFLGNNGKEMVSNEKPTDVLYIMNNIGTGISGNYTSVNLKDGKEFAAYMDAASMSLKPKIVFDKQATEGADYIPYTTMFGSFYLGGNVGSMTYPGTNTMDFNIPINIYNKIVGGCNDAYVPVKYALDFEHPKSDGTFPETKTALNAVYEGGIRGSAAEQDYTETVNNETKIKDRLVLNFKSGAKGGVRIKPMRWKIDLKTWDGIAKKYTKDSKGNYVLYVNPTTGLHDFELNTVDGDGDPTPPVEPETYSTGQVSSEDDLTRRFDGGNIYGGCHNSGIVNGNVVINLETELINRDELFDEVLEDETGEPYYNNDNYTITERRSGVILGQQGMDVLGKALNVFGGGKGKDTQIWGSTTINLTKGYTFQIFGGSQEGVIGKPVILGENQTADYTFEGKSYNYNKDYSCTINVNGNVAGVSKISKNEDGTTQINNNPDMADCEFIYGGGFEGPVCGNAIINLGNGRVFNTFAGACNADILGHTETYIGRQCTKNTDGTYTIVDGGGFPWVRDYVYGANDLGGNIFGNSNFKDRVRDNNVLTKIYGYRAPDEEHNDLGNTNPDVLNASAYVEYIQGRTEGIFGGCYGSYDYTSTKFAKYTYSQGESNIPDGKVAGDPREDSGFNKPHMDNVFVNFRPKDGLTDKKNKVNTIFGAGQGYPGEKDMDMMQESSYVLIDIPTGVGHFQDMEVFGAGAYGGLGMKKYVAPAATPNQTQKAALDKVSAIIDLVKGSIAAAYGASYKEGFTRRTVVNVPVGSTINIQNIFGGAYGIKNDAVCDAYEANVNYKSGDALVTGTIYGGNNAYRRTLYGFVNIDAPVWQDNEKTMLGTVYGAGYGVDTWSQYTEVNLNNGASVWEVYGGGQEGKVANKATAIQRAIDDGGQLVIDSKYAAKDDLVGNDLVTARHDGKKHNTNVIIRKGAVVNNYAYGGGKGIDGVDESGDVNGTTYIALLGGEVKKDLYAAGTIGAVLDKYGDAVLGDGKFKATANAYIAGGTLRNVYGGGWKGGVGYHPGVKADPDNGIVADPNSTVNDILGDSYVTIGIRDDQTPETKLDTLKMVKDETATLSDYGYYYGVPAIQRNAYSGGEGGSIFGTAHLILNNGYIGYEYKYIETTDPTTNETTGKWDYSEKLDDETWEDHKGENRLKDCGNVFGGGYDDKSSCDFTDVTIWGGIIRSSLHGGGEIATVGRGKMKESGSANSVRELQAIYKAGGTKITMFNGHVKRNVFGGGKGYNLLGFGGDNKLYTDGYTFGTTEVYIHGGKIGTKEGLANNYGNVFGGGDVGFVYSRGYFNEKTLSEKNAHPTGATGSPNHWYYYFKKDNQDILSEDCKVVIAPYLQVKDKDGLSINGHNHPQWSYVETDDLNTLPPKETVEENGETSKKFTGDWLKLFTGVNSGVEGATEDTEERGVIIQNAVFGGGNVSSNSDQTYANATTVYGNTTATLYDVYHRDFITVGTEHIGGIYGGGNLSMVDGYRELNISNYGTDYYGLEQRISIGTYRGLSNRERAYFQLQYVCIVEKLELPGGETYAKDKKITEDVYLGLLETYKDDSESVAAIQAAFTPYGFCSIYAGRLLNTIQRADFCGVFGSRMVLQGAKDRVASVGENIDYTINRVGELSLNQQRTMRTAELGYATPDMGKEAIHGNYFGIYSIVNYLGNLTSDVHFDDPLYTKTENGKTVVVTKVKVNGEDVDVNTLTDAERTAAGLNATTYYNWKSSDPTSTNRNKGSSFNQVALASGVFLELTTEKTELNPDKKKDYGYITGVVELDLINVQEELGGGFVYAKNEHRVPKYYPNKSNVILSEYNHRKMVDNIEIRDEAHTYKRFYYTDNDPNNPLPQSSEQTGARVIGGADYSQEKVYETSGNFIHHSKRIVDDCYPINNAYLLNDENRSEAHYWYVKGEVYVYEQKVSAYTGSASAYPKEVHLPLTITAASHGQLKLLNVKPNLYAYYAPTGGDPAAVGKEKIGVGTDVNTGKPIEKVFVDNESQSYGLNDVITWWDWHKLSDKERTYFVAETYVNSDSCVIDNKPYAAGTYALTPEDLATFKSESHTITYINSYGDEVSFTSNGTEASNVKEVTNMFRLSNNIGHETGYVLTFDMDTPEKWSDYYTLKDDKNIDKSITYGESNTTTLKKTISLAEYNKLPQAQQDYYYRKGPTFSPNTSKVYGGHNIKVGHIVTAEAAASNKTTGGATVEDAYVVSESVTYTYNVTEIVNDAPVVVTKTKTLNPRSAISATELNLINEAEIKAKFVRAYVCKSTLQLNTKHYMTNGVLYTKAEIDQLKEDYQSLASDIDDATTMACICTVEGDFGGYQLNNDENYSALEAWCSLGKEDRYDADDNEMFTFNYDALDLLIDTDYLKVKDSGGNYVVATPTEARTEAAFHSPYTDKVKVEYKAVYNQTASQDLEYLKDGSASRSTETFTTNKKISNTEFESLRNDKLCYTRVSVPAGGADVYIATGNITYNGIPYGEGQIVNAEIWAANKSDVVMKHFGEDGSPADVFYYCFKDSPFSGGPKIGDRCDIDHYADLHDDQKYFTIQGMEPTETTTLYVSCESEARDVVQEKVISVVYQYTYYEEDDNGSTKLTNELHVINVRLQLESGVPTIGTLYAPATVLPGNSVGLKAPDVHPGIYEVYTNGWEIFNDEQDARYHRNGVPFTNNSDPVYWYQNQKEWVAFYSETYLGKTYSNPVPLSVANYHDLAAVLADKEHHLHVDYDPDKLDRDCKIYINDYSKLPTTDLNYGKDGIDLLKSLVDLTYQNSSAETTYGALATPDNIKGGERLEIYLHTDIDHGGKTDWEPIGAQGSCFEGNLHGDGHTISGLTKSLFGSLCGNVYNLGVTGKFTKAGIADHGDGFVENCWVKSSATALGNNESKGKAVFSHEDDGCIHVVNCYYPKSNAILYNGGAARMMEDKAFYNGEVAYNLNGFYLAKRYYDGIKLKEGKKYQFLDASVDGTLPAEMSDAWYPTDFAYYPLTGLDQKRFGYVENRFADGDFVYVGANSGTLPTDDNIRLREVTENNITTSYYTPIWPDDYLYFGQVLNYGYAGSSDPVHQEQPSIINRQNERVVANKGNRVYRAPAYYRSSDMESVYFNSNAIFAKTKNGDASTIAHKGLTAIDFAGANDVDLGYKSGLVGVNATGAFVQDPDNEITVSYRFYPPLLDDDGITDFQTHDLTRNLLVYTGTGTNTATKTNDKVGTILHDASYTCTQKYNSQLVDYYDPHDIYGHWVSDGVASNDHLLVDREDFNAPISYSMGNNRMWYQRKPEPTKYADDNYVSLNSGWQSISIPFTAELVTTDNKGEITHFYSGSDESKDDKHAKIGHEYWLRECSDVTASGSDIATANFTYPNAVGTGVREVGNTFLWDYYYQGNHRHLDNNGDTYQDDDKTKYYSFTRNYTGYPLLTNGVPYIIGFPGKTYYEFDLSGEWTATSTGNTPPEQIGKQTITFVSAKGATIGVSDTELERKSTDEYNGYYFKPNYLNIDVPENGYIMASDGGSYEKVTSSTDANKKKLSAFRTYFQADPNVVKAPTRSIVFNNVSSQFGGEEQEQRDHVSESMEFSAKKHKIVVTSHMQNVADVAIYSVSGVCVATFDIKPDETIETPISNSGVYIVRAAGGHYTKKITMK